MGCIYREAEKYSPKDEKGKPVASLALLINPRWGDEDLEHCTPVAEAASERERVALFRQMTDTFIIFPGSVATLQEVSTLIARNYYGGEDKSIIFMIDKEFFKDYVAQYDKLYKTGLISRAPDTLFRLAKSADEVLQAIDKAAEEKVVRVFE